MEVSGMKSRRNWITAGIFAASLVLIVVGVFRNEHLAVMNKAINVCMECIGIG